MVSCNLMWLCSQSILHFTLCISHWSLYILCHCCCIIQRSQSSSPSLAISHSMKVHSSFQLIISRILHSILCILEPLKMLRSATNTNRFAIRNRICLRCRCFIHIIQSTPFHLSVAQNKNKMKILDFSPTNQSINE